MIEKMCVKCGRCIPPGPCKWCAKAWKKSLHTMQKRDNIKKSINKRGNYHGTDQQSHRAKNTEGGQ